MSTTIEAPAASGPSPDSAPRLARLFLEGFTVMDIAEDLCSFDADRPAAEVRAFLERKGFDLVGVRRDGLVAGYARREDLVAGACGDHLRPFGPDDLVDAASSLAETIRSLDANGRCFVRVLDRPAAIVTHRDLEKPPVRMWLFGMVTILEMRMTAWIRDALPEAGWTARLTPERLAATLCLRDERRRMGQEADLLDCLQFGDKAAILLKERPEFRARFPSARAAKTFFKDLQRLRNNLAHAQGYVATDWRVIVGLTAALRAIVGAPAP